jgi:hypothetical protein
MIGMLQVTRQLAGVANLIEGIFGEKFASQLEMYVVRL